MSLKTVAYSPANSLEFTQTACGFRRCEATALIQHLQVQLQKWQSLERNWPSSCWRRRNKKERERNERQRKGTDRQREREEGKSVNDPRAHMTTMVLAVKVKSVQLVLVPAPFEPHKDVPAARWGVCMLSTIITLPWKPYRPCSGCAELCLLGSYNDTHTKERYRKSAVHWTWIQ